MNKPIYILVHDTNSGIGVVRTTVDYLKMRFNQKGGLSKEDFDKAMKWLLNGSGKIKNAVDEYYKTLKENE